MLNTLLNAAISFAITVAVVAAALVVIESLKRRGFDPVGRVAAVLSPPTEATVGA
jgi:hypothetical protein